jgi:hypothetical protein
MPTTVILLLWLFYTMYNKNKLCKNKYRRITWMELH